QHEGKDLVIAVLSGGHGDGLRDEVKGQHGNGEDPGQDDEERDAHFEARANDGGHAGGAQIVGGEHALDNEEVGGPVAEADDQAESEDDADPVDAHGVGAEGAESLPQVDIMSVAHVVDDLLFEVVPAADFDESEDGDEQRAGPDKQELKDLIEDGGAESAEDDVKGDGGGGKPDAEVEVPSEDDLHDER